MASLYKINSDILLCLDLETGEVIDPEKLEQLQMDKREKLRNIALLAKNKASDIQQFKEQEQLFAKRRKAAENTLAWCKATLQAELNGQKMEEAEFVVSYRPSESIEIDADAEIPAEFLKQREPDIDRMALKAVLKDGAEIPGIRLVRKSNIQIK